MLNLLTDIAGVSVGHATDLAMGTGVTAILFDQPAIASVSVLGGAPGSRDTTMLEPDMTIDRVDAIALGGGSVFGLDAAGGVLAWVREHGRGEVFGLVPIVPGAIIFDLRNGGDKDWGRFSPYRDMGYAAAEAARAGPFALGTVGAGTGATTPLVKGGIGSASGMTAEGYRVRRADRDERHRQSADRHRAAFLGGAPSSRTENSAVSAGRPPPCRRMPCFRASRACRSRCRRAARRSGSS